MDWKIGIEGAVLVVVGIYTCCDVTVFIHSIVSISISICIDNSSFASATSIALPPPHDDIIHCLRVNSKQASSAPSVHSGIASPSKSNASWSPPPISRYPWFLVDSACSRIHRHEDCWLLVSGPWAQDIDECPWLGVVLEVEEMC